MKIYYDKEEPMDKWLSIWTMMLIHVFLTSVIAYTVSLFFGFKSAVVVFAILTCVEFASVRWKLEDRN